MTTLRHVSSTKRALRAHKKSPTFQQKEPYIHIGAQRTHWWQLCTTHPPPKETHTFTKKQYIFTKRALYFHKKSPTLTTESTECADDNFASDVLHKKSPEYIHNKSPIFSQKEPYIQNSAQVVSWWALCAAYPPQKEPCIFTKQQPCISAKRALHSQQRPKSQLMSTLRRISSTKRAPHIHTTSPIFPQKSPTSIP